MNCNREMCKKTWEGDDPKCPFVRPLIMSNMTPISSLKFSEENWNCGGINQIRKLLWEWYDNLNNRIKIPWIYVNGYNNQWFGLINLNMLFEYGAIEGIVESDVNTFDYSNLWISWYKQQGKTDNMILLSENFNVNPRSVTLEDLDVIIKAHKIACKNRSEVLNETI